MKHTLTSIHARCIPAEGDCLIWQGATTGHKTHPTPCLKTDGTNRSARPVVLKLARKPRPSLQHTRVITTCGNPLCLNPAHLRWATTSKINQAGARNRAAGDTLRRSKIAATMRERRAKLTPEQVREIRASTDLQHVLAMRYQVRQAHISNIRLHKAWRDYTTPFAGLGARPGHAPGTRA